MRRCNTDFSQVEADEQQVNLTRFSVLFPEKRDFFLENSGIFQFGLPATGTASVGGGESRCVGSAELATGRARLFFSRQIGLSESGAAIPILAGARVTGRAGRSSVWARSTSSSARRDRCRRPISPRSACSAASSPTPTLA